MVWRIDATDEWTYDDALAESAELQGLGAVHYDEEGLTLLIEQLEEKIRERDKVSKQCSRQSKSIVTMETKLDS